MAQNKATLRTSLRSALSHKKLADDFLDTIVGTQTRMNDLIAKLDADTGIALDIDYVATVPSTSTLDVDGSGTDAQHKASFRTSMRSALRNKGLADDLLDSIEELDAAMDATVAKLDAETGTLNDTDYVSTLALTVDDPEASAGDAPYKASRRVTLTSALSRASSADTIVDAMNEMQTQWNRAMAVLDTGTVNTSFSTATPPIAVSPIDPDA